jgi:hypothetical protein
MAEDFQVRIDSSDVGDAGEDTIRILERLEKEAAETAAKIRSMGSGASGLKSIATELEKATRAAEKFRTQFEQIIRLTSRTRQPMPGFVTQQGQSVIAGLQGALGNYGRASETQTASQTTTIMRNTAAAERREAARERSIRTAEERRASEINAIMQRTPKSQGGLMEPKAGFSEMMKGPLGKINMLGFQAWMTAMTAGMVTAPIIAGTNREIENKRAASGLGFASRGLSAKDQARLPGEVGAFAGKFGGEKNEMSALFARVFAGGETDVENARKKVRLALDLQATGITNGLSAIDGMNKATAENEEKLKTWLLSLGRAVKGTETFDELIVMLNKTVEGRAEASTGKTQEMLKAEQNINMAKDTLSKVAYKGADLGATMVNASTKGVNPMHALLFRAYSSMFDNDDGVKVHPKHADKFAGGAPNVNANLIKEEKAKKEKQKQFARNQSDYVVTMNVKSDPGTKVHSNRSVGVGTR